MNVLLRKNIPNLGNIGDVVAVKPGYARNYLLPQGLATVPTQGNLRKIEAEKATYLAELAQLNSEIEARAKLVDGKEVTITALANEEGHLYGSVGPARVVEALAKEGLSVEEENVVLDEPIRMLDKYEVSLRFGSDVTATINVWVIPARVEEEESAEMTQALETQAEAAPDEE